MSTLMDSIASRITPELTSTLASHFAIPPDTVNSALQAASANMLTTLATKAHDTAFLTSIFHAITGSGNTAAAAAGAGFATSTIAAPAETSSRFLSSLFGSGLPAVEAKIAQMAGVSSAAGAGVVASAAPLVMGALSDKINAGGMNVAALGSLLAAELPPFKGDVRAQSIRKIEQEPKSSASWLWPVALLGILLIAALIWFFNRGKEAIVSESATQTAAAVTDSAKAPITSLGAFFKRKLPDGVELNIPQNGIENNLIAFIEDSSKPVDKETWFDFDRLLFASGSSTLEPSSTEQLQNVAAIMKAYPNVHLRIGGYTDNTGDAAANQKLSQSRANSVLAQLVSLGVEPARLDARGYGEEHPVADNATEAGRAQNRRISVRVTRK